MSDLTIATESMSQPDKSAMSESGDLVLLDEVGDEEDVDRQKEILTEEKSEHKNDVVDLTEDEANGVNRESTTPEANSDTCQNCKERKVFRHNLCYRCRGTSGEYKNSGRSQHYKQSDEEFVSKCLEISSKRRVSTKPVTFIEEFLVPSKRARTEEVNPTISNEDDISPDPLNERLPDLLDIKEEPEDDGNFCNRWHVESTDVIKPRRQSEPVHRPFSANSILVKDNGATLSNSRNRKCDECLKIKPHYARNRCKQCYDRLASYCRRTGISMRDYPTDSSPPKPLVGCSECGQVTDGRDLCVDCNPDDTGLDFSNYRVCEECRSYEVHHCRGLCRPCYEQDLKNKRMSALSERPRSAISIQESSQISPPFQTAKRSKSDVTSCVVCNSELNEETTWPGSIVCRQCHIERKHRHRWCVSCNQLRVHDGGGKCRPCNLASKGIIPSKSPPKAVESQKSDLRSDNFDRILSNKSSAARQSAPVANFSQDGQFTHCVVCHDKIDFSKLPRGSKVCLKCREQGMQRMRWCLGCGQLKMCIGHSRCSQCYTIYRKNADAPKSVQKPNLKLSNSASSGQSNILDQVQALINQVTQQKPKPAPVVDNMDVIRDHQEYLREQELNKSDVNCLVCHKIIDFAVQTKNSKICTQCREKGLGRMRWCIDCKKLKHQQGRQRCLDCYRIHMGMTPTNKQTNSTADTSSSTMNEAEQTLLEQLTNIINQFVASTSAKKTSALPQQNKRPIEPKPDRPKNISAVNLESATNCVICQALIDFKKQARNTKICVDCNGKNLKKYRWCCDCSQLKICIGRQRCSPCYTAYMKQLNAGQKKEPAIKSNFSQFGQSGSNSLDIDQPSSSDLVLNVNSNLNLNQGFLMDKPSTSRQSDSNTGFGHKLAAALNKLSQNQGNRSSSSNKPRTPIQHDYVDLSSGDEDN